MLIQLTSATGVLLQFDGVPLALNVAFPPATEANAPVGVRDTEVQVCAQPAADTMAKIVSRRTSIRLLNPASIWKLWKGPKA